VGKQTFVAFFQAVLIFSLKINFYRALFLITASYKNG